MIAHSVLRYRICTLMTSTKNSHPLNRCETSQSTFFLLLQIQMIAIMQTYGIAYPPRIAVLGRTVTPSSVSYSAGCPACGFSSIWAFYRGRHGAKFTYKECCILSHKCQIFMLTSDISIILNPTIFHTYGPWTNDLLHHTKRGIRLSGCSHPYRSRKRYRFIERR